MQKACWPISLRATILKPWFSSRLGELAGGEGLGVFVDIDEELTEAAEGADESLPNDDCGHDLYPDTLVHEALHAFMDRVFVAADIGLDASDERVARQGRLVLLLPILVEGVEASCGDELIEPQDRHQPVLPIKSVKESIAVVEIPVGSSGLQIGEGEAVVHGGLVKCPFVAVVLVDPMLVGDKQERRELVMAAGGEVGSHCLLASPVRLALLDRLDRVLVDGYAFRALDALPEDGKVGGEAHLGGNPPERDRRDVGGDVPHADLDGQVVRGLRAEFAEQQAQGLPILGLSAHYVGNDAVVRVAHVCSSWLAGWLPAMLNSGRSRTMRSSWKALVSAASTRAYQQMAAE